MLTIQPALSNNNINNVSFGCKDKVILIQDLETGDYVDKKNSKALMNNDTFDINKEEEADYNENKSFWEDQKQTFDSLTSDTEVPSLFKKGAKAVSVIVSAILGGMAMVWGSKKSINAAENLAKTKKVKTFTDKVAKNYKSFKTMMSDVYKTTKNSEFVKSIKTSYNKKVQQFNNSKFGQNKVVKVFTDSIKFIKNRTIKGYDFIAGKLKGIKGTQIKNATINTMGVSGGITSGVSALKETNKSENSDKEVA